jgi:hypothetical protein
MIPAGKPVWILPVEKIFFSAMRSPAGGAAHPPIESFDKNADEE